MELMPCRYEGLQQTLEAYQQTGIPQVAIVDGHFAAPCIAGDSMGVYSVIPQLAHALGLPLEAAINLFLYGVVAVGFFSGAVGLWHLCTTKVQRLLAALQFGLLLWFTLRAVEGIYVFGVSVTIGTVPWALLALQGDTRRWKTLCFCILAGLAIGLSHLCRVHSATAAAVFITFLALTQRQWRWQYRAMAVGAMCCAAAVPWLWLQHQVHQRDAFLAQHPHSQQPGVYSPWHSIYIGLGFLANDYGIRYKDEVAHALVEAKRPGTGYLSPEYHGVLRDAVLDLARTDRNFIFKNVAAKSGVVFAWFAGFANIGLIAALFCHQPRRMNLAFLAAGPMAAAPGVIVMPAATYVSALLALGAMYGIVSVNHWLENAAPAWLRGGRRVEGIPDPVSPAPLRQAA